MIFLLKVSSSFSSQWCCVSWKDQMEVLALLLERTPRRNRSFQTLSLLIEPASLSNSNHDIVQQEEGRETVVLQALCKDPCS